MQKITLTKASVHTGHRGVLQKSTSSKEGRGNTPVGSLSSFWRMCPLFYPKLLVMCIAFFLSPLSEVAGRYRLPKHPTTYSPFYMYSPCIMHCKVIKFSFKLTLGREVHTPASLKPSHFPLKFKSSDCDQLCNKFAQISVSKDLRTHSSRPWLILSDQLAICKDIHTHFSYWSQCFFLQKIFQY